MLMLKNKRTSRTRLSGMQLLLAGLILLGLALGAYGHFGRKTSHQVPSSHPSESTASPAGKSSQESSDKQTSQSSVSSSSPKTDSGSTSASLKPTGNFVSNHKPGQGGSPMQEQSTCSTTPGASCYIRFTKGNDTRTLAAGVANSNGIVIWNWDAASFPKGTWQITAIASWAGQTQTTNDDMDLIIQ